MLWLYLAIAAYALNAVAFIIDKYLLSAPILRPISYAFWVGMLSFASIVLLPFGVYWVNFFYFLISFASGAAFFFALLFLYKAIKKTDISVASTKVGVLGVIFTYIFSALILRSSFLGPDIVALVFMVAGILLIGKTGKGVWPEALMSGVAFGVSTVLLKWTFNHSDFLNGFFWTRMGLVGMAFLTLIHPFARKEMFLSLKNTSRSSRSVFLVNKIIAGIGFLLLYISIKLGNVSVVSTLLSAQFVFVFILALIFRQRIPGVSENINGKILLVKFLGVVLIGLGFLMLFKQ
ncbi:MAG: hypothetical protein A3I26_00655 [Candidatus Yanofskybacteria bacterium RIFCSPLOWO2_02_FULL_43_10]|uniref:Uncharacterized protein n=1 Tax=Candidatus Yanofskybacteria bacterium RIFCSPLOWO2_12_FULL_43_11b TaxID=1802710 RepID=A0A1F8H8L0_9BACT|nr:MAG: hypothetical protein A2742_03870 [Candidatus Yanofskybacteria bacterium RIFCSPHIGHO2_01_FULL_43_32]OGN10936.1 MAG: hypothetical protein A3C69_03080 [Candidatus Yanofskybacteria bacterium RIFCSPHIGHO2_02_FULL_43_12]OGN17085.1 MAG: hypothetical protein A3E34_03385 [Candidatus Yanofskybacteria bacterium RIFCSPHIGHO2_12_FULL_43_11]OGN24419.1 MAG: hypothetical protein A2923_00855 [Candidatus Yanofskybacteria bacterium RIFCSPLOWO2_01_FULL_43_46]OGN28484.1 MAG: hypothetical protein A3I26_00655